MRIYTHFERRGRYEQNTTTILKGMEQFENFNIAKNLSPQTIRHYNDSLNIFKEFYDCEQLCNTITESVVFAFTAHLKQKGTMGDISINTHLRAVRAMCYYFMKLGYLEPFQVTMLRTQKTIKETYTDNELETLLKKPKLSKTTFAEYRNWVLINYLLATGNRVGTICDLKNKDVDFTAGTIKLCRTKNRREQIIPVSRSLGDILKEYIKHRQGDEDDYLFCNANGVRLSEEGLKLAIRKYNRKRGVMKTSAHLFRHTFAKKWILNGGDVFRLQKILGHSSMDIVREYVNMFSDDLKRDFDNFNPLEEFSTKRGEEIKIKPKAKKPQRITLRA
jgi:integrase/recombinase XerD